MESKSTCGLFSILEKNDHTDFLELKAVLLGLKLTHIKVLCDNSTAIAYINTFVTSRSFECNSLAQEIWAWAGKANTWLSINHLPGVQNFEADLESCKQEIHTEWKLKESIFQFLCRKLDFSQNIDLLPTRTNTQLPINLTQIALQSMNFCSSG